MSCVAVMYMQELSILMIDYILVNDGWDHRFKGKKPKTAEIVVKD